MIYRMAPFSMTLTTPTRSFKVTPFFDVELYYRNGTTYRHSFNEILIWSYTPFSTVSFRMALSDLELLSNIFNDMKRRAVSLRQLSFLPFKLAQVVHGTMG